MIASQSQLRLKPKISTDSLFVYNPSAAPDLPYPVHRGEFWTAKQRQMHPVHYSVSYRASFKPELPDYFLQRYAPKSATVLDPFGGRGTTTLQSNLRGHRAIHSDISPVSVFIASARQSIPSLAQMTDFLGSVNLSKIGRNWSSDEKDRFSPFFHRETFRELSGLRRLWFDRQDDPLLKYIMLTALTRLHGHSDGFFSVYSFPQISIAPKAQLRNNQKRGLSPEYKSISERILKKAARDLSQPIPDEFYEASRSNKYLNGDARRLKGVAANSVDLVITSPPFLDKVDYAKDNWMRAWFIGVEEDVDASEMAIFSNPKEWLFFMRQAIVEMGRVLKVGGRAVIEVGEVEIAGQTLFLEELLATLFPLQLRSGRLVVDEIFLHSQEFTKLANCWDVTNNQKGTNTHRCLVIRKESVTKT